MTIEFKVPIKLFDLGQVVSTPGAMAATTFDMRAQCLARHVRGDWGCVDQEDWATNFDALMNGLRILSAYPLDPPCPARAGATIRCGSSPRPTAA